MVNVDNLFRIISEKGISQSKVAKDTSVSTGNISDWKNGKSLPSASKLDELATYLECSVDYLLGRTDKPNPETTITENNGNGVNHGVQTFHGDSFPVKLEIPAEQKLDENQQELLKRFAMLSYVDKIEFMQMLINKTEKESELS